MTTRNRNQGQHRGTLVWMALICGTGMLIILASVILSYVAWAAGLSW